MKNLTRLFVAAAALVAFSCTTDATEDLAVQVDGAVQTEIVLSLEASRTQLGEKVGDLYPLYWSEGDKIAVNGVVSNEVSADAVGAAAATFTLNGTLEYPYNVVYPAPAEGIVAATEGCYPVVFPATQEYKVGNIDGKAAVMYGYAEEGSAPTLHHLTGVLRFAVKGEATLAQLVVKAQSGAIAGTYDVNCATGALTAQAGSTSDAVTVSFGDGLALGAEATPIYVPVPAGEYGTVEAILTTTAGEKMSVLFKSSGEKAIKAGVVREFNEFAFEANVDDSAEFVIDSKEALIRFAMNPSKSAVVTAAIDMTGYDWTPIEGFDALVFDGGNFEIKGLNAPLFNSTTSEIKNVKLVDVDLCSNNVAAYGAIACKILAIGETPGKLTNCSASGKLVVNNPDYELAASYSTANFFRYGGLLGDAGGVDISGCVNRVDITVKQLNKVGATCSSTLTPEFGGIVGHASFLTVATDNFTKTTIKNCHNYGTIKYEDIDTTPLYRPYIAGIAAYGTESAAVVIENCINDGPISINATTKGDTGANNSLCMGGIVGRTTKGSIKNCTNNAPITADGTLKSIAIGGALGYVYNVQVEGVVNKGAVLVKESARISGIVAGGVGAQLYNGSGGDGFSKSCTNEGSVTVLASTMENYGTGAYYYRIGGVTGFGRNALSDCVNKGDVYTAGNIINVATGTSELNLQIAGVVAYKTVGGITNCDNYGDVTVNTHFTNHSTDTSVIQGQVFSIGGVSAYSTYNPSQSENHGTITFGGSYVGYRTFIGGIHADGITNNICPSDGAVNNGDIVIAKGAVLDITQLYLGGICGGTERTTALTSATNNGNIFIDGTVTGLVRLGGITGYRNYTCSGTVVNNGNITFGENSAVGTGDSFVGGCYGYMTSSNEAHTFQDMVNNGKITFKGTNKGVLTLGGVSGSGGVITLDNVTNNGDIEVNATLQQTLRVGGVIGYTNNEKCKTSNLHNYGKITVNAEHLNKNNTYVGGVIGLQQGLSADYCYNHENSTITVNVKNGNNVEVGGVTCKFQDNTTYLENHADIAVGGTCAGYVAVSGVITESNGYTRKYHANTGDITVSAKSEYYMAIGGINAGGNYEKAYTECYNTGNITVTEEAEAGANLYIGGLIGYKGLDSQGNFNNCYNSGNIVCKARSGFSTAEIAATAYNKEYKVCIGSLIGQSRQDPATGTSYPKITGKFVNTGNVEYSGTNESGSVYVGGIIGVNDVPTTSAYWAGTVYNLANVKSTGSAKNEHYVGGIFGKTVSSVQNCVVYGTVQGKGAQNVGMIMGSARAEGSVVATACQVGGSIVNVEYDEEDEAEKEVTVALTAENYYKYVYGSRESSDADGGSVLTEKPVIE